MRIVASDPDRPRRAAEAIDALLAAALGPFVALEPIGSTAVPGLAAKPVIDLMGAVPALTAARPHEPALAALGFRLHSA
ncbi:GrpB family protein [Streptomyces sp. NPDC006476]|uniref:GrpB family protein n=1 Tax=Streptomyces sp. NPDC006476 TaxID=3157175 RepID=UPI0033A2B883